MVDLRVLAKRELARRELMKRDMLKFTEHMELNYKAGWVHKDIAHRLERFSADIIAEKSPRLMLLLPPRHGKSTLASQIFPAWHLGLMPHHEIINVGYNMDLPVRFSRRVRELLSTPEYAAIFPDTKLDPKSQSVEAWLTTERGGFCASGREGGITGKGCFSKGNQVLTEHGEVSIEGIIPGDKVASFNHELQTVQYCKVLATRSLISDELYDLETTAGRRVTGTGNHPVYIPRQGYRVLESLCPGTPLVSILREAGTGEDNVRLLSRSSSGPQLVYDLEVEQNANFFVEGLLVHNCHALIVDDPLKNIDEADNFTIREKLEDWYRSTAYTRLAPGGGVLLIECMTGDTPVLLPNGAEKRLDKLRVGDEVATFDEGKLSAEKVTAWSCSGWDRVYKITTRYGKMIRANKRHPFLVETDTGELEWVRLKNLKLGQKIVTVKGSGENTRAKNVRTSPVVYPLSAEDSATPTTISGSGPQDIVHHQHQQNRNRGLMRSSNIATVLTWLNISSSWLRRTVNALFVSSPLSLRKVLSTGRGYSASITATPLTRPEDFYVTLATSPSNEGTQSKYLKKLSSTSDFTTEEVIAINPDGEEYVYDLTVENTHNFIANVIVVKNTMWHDDDLAGRLMAKMEYMDDADQFEVVRYPAISEQYEYRDRKTFVITKTDTALSQSAVADYDLLRKPNQALHPERYSLEFLERVKAQDNGGRIWSALYQQDPVPREGLFFKAEDFHLAPAMPSKQHRRYYMAWDFAISMKQRADYTVGVTLLQDDADNLYVVDLVRFRGDSRRIGDEFTAMIERWSGIAGSSLQLGVEDGQIWKSLKPMLKQRMREERAYISIETMQALTDKESRARPLQGRMEHRKFYFVEGSPWWKDAHREMTRFPAGRHDDIVDALAWATRLATGKKPKRLPAPKSLRSWKDKLGKYTTGATGGGHMAS